MKSEGSLADILARVGERHGVRHVFFYESTDSTNTRAKFFQINEARGDKSPAIFIARAQTAGRGTHARGFESPSGGGLYISFLFYPKILAKDSARITTYAATRVCRAIERTCKDVKNLGIKWVNDVYVSDRKISGILTEGVAGEGGALDFAIVGIGINVKGGYLSDSLSSIAASLEDFGMTTDIGTLAEALTDEFFAGLPELSSKKTMEEYQSRSMLIGRRVMISKTDCEGVYTVLGITDEGALLAKDENGNTKKFISATVTIL